MEFFVKSYRNTTPHRRHGGGNDNNASSTFGCSQD